MTRTRLISSLLAAVALLVAIAATTAGANDDQRFTVVLDNAFGLTKGADLRSSGVKVGKVEELDVQRKTARALATVVVSRPDFAGFRKDVFCEVKPQSLIGEYFLDCAPGTSAEPASKTIPVQQTAGTIPPDLVFEILRRPARERFGLILSELGSGLAARGEDLQTVIRRGVPALRETDEVLRILDANRRTLQQLTRDADQVLAAVAGNREDVRRFVTKAADTTDASADRRLQLAQTVDKLPRFLRELRPTLRDLGTAAKRQTPALRDLRLAAPDLTTLLRRLSPFADSARPAVRGLGRASVTGVEAAREARSTVRQLRALGTVATEPMRNLRFVLEDVNDRGRAVEPNRLSPTGAGFTGLEALLQYFFVQSQAINLHDSKGYLLKLGLLVNQCSPYVNARTAIKDKAHTNACKQWLGPNQPGITTGAIAHTTQRTPAAKTPKAPDERPPDQTPPAAAAARPETPARTPPAPPPPPPLLPKVDPRQLLDDILPRITDKLPKIGRRSARARGADSERNLLDFLLEP
jgi:ABC-type transporter Mla subunit MlaD